MKRTLHIVAPALVWTALALLLGWAGGLGRERRGAARVERVQIDIEDSLHSRAVTAPTVRRWLDEARLDLLGAPCDSVNTLALARLLGSQPFVAEADAYTDLRGTLHLRIVQRRPILRIRTESGHDCYLSDDGRVLPVIPGAAYDVPVVTGRLELPFAPEWTGPLAEAAVGAEKNVESRLAFLYKLINFVQTIEDHRPWMAQFVQIVIAESHGNASQQDIYNPDIELVPRAGDHIVRLGTLDRAAEKLDKLLLFYREALDWQGWSSVRTIDLRYENQIVCTQ